jgi:aminoglycoside phosphotransferase (APT) family kinase protein
VAVKQFTKMLVAPETRDLSTTAQTLADWLRARMPDAEELRVDHLEYPQGAGRSHETILFEAAWSVNAVRHARGCVVRIKPVRHTVFPDDLFAQQYQVMKLMHERGQVRVARPLWFEADASVLGAPFFVMERVRGRVAVSFPPYRDVGWVSEATPAERAKMWQNGVRQLAAIQSTPIEAAAFLGGPPGAQSGLAQEWDKYERFVDWVSRERPWPVFRRALDRLRASWPKNQPPGLVWGDARLGNMMFDERFEVAAVMDWEQPSLGGALNDLAWWLVISEMMHGARPDRPHLPGMGTREDTIALWSEVTGISAADVEWYEDFTRLKLSLTAVRLGQLKTLPMPDEAALAQRMKVASMPA